MTPTEKADELMRLAPSVELANVAFNWAQHQGYVLTQADCDMLHSLRLAHDAARSTLRAAIEQALREASEQRWLPIEQAPKGCRTMFVVRGFNVTNENCHVRNYTTDPYCVWPGKDGGWVRWPHPFPPTHYMPLPAAPAQPAAEPVAGPWRVEWDNDTGADDGYYVEWWNVINDATETHYRAETKEAAERLAALLNAKPAAEPEPVGIALTVETVYPHFGDALARHQDGKSYTLNTGTKGIDFAKLKPGMRLTAQVNERNFVVSATVEGE